MTIKDYRGNDVQVQPGMTVWVKPLNDTSRIYRETTDPDFGDPCIELMDCRGTILADFFRPEDLCYTYSDN